MSGHPVTDKPASVLGCDVVVGWVGEVALVIVAGLMNMVLLIVGAFVSDIMLTVASVPVNTSVDKDNEHPLDGAVEETSNVSVKTDGSKAVGCILLPHPKGCNELSVMTGVMSGAVYASEGLACK